MNTRSMEGRGYACLMLLGLCTVMAWLGVFSVSAQESGPSGLRSRMPNVVMILADDLGWGDLGCYGSGSKVPTPRLDGLAREGLRFTDAHSPSAVCTPTRYGLLTGRYAWRTRLKSGVLWGYSPPLWETNQVTLPRWMEKRGYETACIGKWHLGLGWPTRIPVEFGDQAKPAADVLQIDFRKPLGAGPHTFGFGYSFILPASLDMDPYVFVENGSVVGGTMGRVAAGVSQRQGGSGFWRAGPIAGGFSHERCEPELIARAESFLGRQTPERPFFLYLALTSPHDPWVTQPEYRGRSGLGARGDAVLQMDAMVGRVLDVLERRGLSRQTLVIFTSDNGAHWLPSEVEKTGHRANGPWRGMKSDLWEGGHRVPLLVRWPGVVRAGRVSEVLVGHQDWFATLAGLLGEKLESDMASDSEDFAAVLRGRDRWERRRPLVLHSIQGKFGIRWGAWKWIEDRGSGGWTGGDTGTESQLYDLREDPTETRNLAAGQPGRVRLFRDQLHEIRIREVRVE